MAANVEIASLYQASFDILFGPLNLLNSEVMLQLMMRQ